jgi:hypothetical protein
MIYPPQLPDPRVAHWLERHVTRTSFCLHMVGIPPTILGVLLVPIYLCLLSAPIFLLALGLFVGGYLLQFAGHALEGTDPGEIVYFKRKLGRPYVEFPGQAPQTAQAPSAAVVPPPGPSDTLPGTQGSWASNSPGTEPSAVDRQP